MEILILVPLEADVVQSVKGLASDGSVHRVEPGTPEYDSLLGRAEIICGWPGVESLDRATNLKWLQLASAGADRYVDKLAPDVLLTNASGTYGICIAEHVLAMMLALTRGVHWMVRAQIAHVWKREFRGFEVFGQTMGIIGLGDIGTQTARRAKALGMTVLANRRSPGQKPDFVDELHGPDGLHDILGRSDHVVVTVPGGAKRRDLIGRDEIAAMKDGAYFYNVGRGTTVDEPALIEALQSGKLSGAGLDVFRNEPLEPESPLWRMENVILSPHEAGATQRQWQRIGEIFLDNLRRYLAGDELRNLVDRGQGY